MKPIIWLENTIKIVRSYPPDIKREIGYNLDKIQHGEEPYDWKAMRGMGHGVHEIRIHAENEYRVIYIAKFPEAVYVLHSFIKKSQKTAQQDIELAKKRYDLMLNMRKLL